MGAHLFTQLSQLYACFGFTSIISCITNADFTLQLDLASPSKNMLNRSGPTVTPTALTQSIHSARYNMMPPPPQNIIPLPYLTLLRCYRQSPTLFLSSSYNSSTGVHTTSLVLGLPINFFFSSIIYFLLFKTLNRSTSYPHNPVTAS